MKVLTSDPAKLTDFKLLSFDCFGTLVDWESGAYTALYPLLSRLPQDHPYHKDRNLPIHHFDTLENALCASKPTLPYPSLLSESYHQFAHELRLPQPSEAESKVFGQSVAKWPAFPDTVAALQRLKKYYKLVILSNIDDESIAQVLEGALKGVQFDAVYTAQQIGSYKPDMKNFHYLLRGVEKEFGVKKGEVLHTAHGLRADHVPAKEMGLKSAWIVRGEGVGKGSTMEDVKDRVAFTWQFESMGAMDEAVEKEFGGVGR